MTVTAYDERGNVATGYTGTVQFTSTDGPEDLPPDYTFTGSDDGVHTFSVTLVMTGLESIVHVTDGTLTDWATWFVSS